VKTKRDKIILGAEWLNSRAAKRSFLQKNSTGKDYAPMLS